MEILSEIINVEKEYDGFRTRFSYVEVKTTYRLLNCSNNLLNCSNNHVHYATYSRKEVKKNILNAGVQLGGSIGLDSCHLSQMNKNSLFCGVPSISKRNFTRWKRHHSENFPVASSQVPFSSPAVIKNSSIILTDLQSSDISKLPSVVSYESEKQYPQTVFYFKKF